MTVTYTVSHEAIRSYIHTLRKARNVTQDSLAGVMGLSRRGYIKWETGKTKEAKVSPLLRALRFLGGSPDDIAQFGDTSTAEDGRQAALAWLKSQTEDVQTEVARLETINRQQATAILLRQLADLMDQGLSPQAALQRVTDERASAD